MSQIRERQIGDLVVRIDRTLCVGFENCIDAASEAFALDGDGVAVFLDGVESIGRDRLIEACRACPVDALSVHDLGGRQIVP